MKTTLKLGNLEIAELGLKLENIEVTQEYSINEAISGLNMVKSLAEELVNEMPGLVRKAKIAMDSVDQIEEEQTIDERKTLMNSEIAFNSALKYLSFAEASADKEKCKFYVEKAFEFYTNAVRHQDEIMQSRIVNMMCRCI